MNKDKQDVCQFPSDIELFVECNTQSKIGFWKYIVNKDELIWSDVTRSIHGIDDKSYKPNIETALSFYLPESRERIVKAFHLLLEKQEAYDNVVKIKTDKGEIKTTRAIGKPLIHNNETVGVYGTFEDITTYQNVSDNYAKALKIASDQNHKLKNFNNIISHNLKSNSGNIKALIELFKTTHPKIKDDPIFSHLEQSSKNLNKTLNDLNILLAENSKITDSKISINVRELINENISELNYLAKVNQVKLINKVDEDLDICTNKPFLKSICHNLITNAIKYRDENKESCLTITSEVTDNQNILTFKDNGLGIDLNLNRDKIFKIYNTFHTNKNIDSRGLGLYMVKNQVETLGGSIEVESTQGEGSVFTIKIPL